MGEGCETDKYIENNSKSNTLIEQYKDKSIAYIGVVNDVKNGEDCYPMFCIPSNREFTPKFKRLKLGNYKSSIPNLNSTSGITNRKFK